MFDTNECIDAAQLGTMIRESSQFDSKAITKLAT